MNYTANVSTRKDTYNFSLFTTLQCTVYNNNTFALYIFSYVEDFCPKGFQPLKITTSPIVC